MKEEVVECRIAQWIKNAEKNGELVHNRFHGKAIKPTCSGNKGNIMAAMGASSIASVHPAELDSKLMVK